MVPDPNGAGASTEQAVIDWCRDNMAAYKVPRFVAFVDSLPKSATGKISGARCKSAKMQSIFHGTSHESITQPQPGVLTPHVGRRSGSLVAARIVCQFTRWALIFRIC